MRDIGIKKICKVLKNDVGAETLEQILDALLQRSEGATESCIDDDKDAKSIDLMQWLKEIITFDRFSLTIRLMDASLLSRVVAWLDSYSGDDTDTLQLVRTAFTER
jgi:hypothetical protein